MAEIRLLVEREWNHQRRTENRVTVNESLRQQYDIEIEWPNLEDPKENDNDEQPPAEESTQ